MNLKVQIIFVYISTNGRDALISICNIVLNNLLTLVWSFNLKSNDPFIVIQIIIGLSLKIIMTKIAFNDN